MDVAVVWFYCTEGNINRFYMHFSHTAPVSLSCQQDSTRFLLSVVWNQDSSSSHSVFVIYLMNEFGNLDKLPNLSDCPSAKWRRQ